MRHLKLWITFSVSITIIIFLVSLLTTYIGFLLVQSQVQNQAAPLPIVPLVSLVLTAIIISSGLTILVSRLILVPIGHLIHALQEVAAGNFKIQLDEHSTYAQIRDMNVNFNTMVKRLDSIEMLQSDFIQNVSHEFKTPLSSIQGYTTLLHAAPLPEDLHGYADQILKSTRQLESLTGNILKLSNLENQPVNEKKEKFFLDEQLRQAILTLEHRWSEKQINIEPDLPVTAYYGNINLLYQVWVNLLSNAVKFTPEYGTVNVTLSETPDEIIVSIHDTGIGMVPEIHSRIFDKFYQGEAGHSTEGNGLGLALVKKIVTLCKGQIDVQSTPGNGSVFVVRLPVNMMP